MLTNSITEVPIASGQVRGEGLTRMYLLVFLEAGLALFLVGLLAAHRLFLRDLVFTTYLLWFATLTFGLWLLAQSQLATRLYGVAYYSLNAIGLALGLAILARAGVKLAPMLGAWLIASLIYVWKDAPLWQRLEGAAGGWLLAMGLLALLASFYAPAGFEQTKLRGLALFWLTQSAASLLYWARGSEASAWVETATASAAIFGAVAFLWMAFAFVGIGLEGSRGAVELDVDSPPQEGEILASAMGSRIGAVEE